MDPAPRCQDRECEAFVADLALVSDATKTVQVAPTWKGNLDCEREPPGVMPLAFRVQLLHLSYGSHRATSGGVFDPRSAWHIVFCWCVNKTS